jgi:hypothetical protein
VFTVTKHLSNARLMIAASLVAPAFPVAAGSAIAVANQHVSYRSVRPPWPPNPIKGRPFEDQPGGKKQASDHGKRLNQILAHA